MSRTVRVASAVVAAAATFPDRAAISDGDCLHDYASLSDAVEYFAADLVEAGVQPGARVGIYVGSGYEALLAVLAVEQIAAVAAPLDISEAPEFTRRQIADIGIDHLIGHREHEHLVVDVADEMDTFGPTMTSIAGDYTLARSGRGPLAPGSSGGAVFGLQNGAGLLEVGSEALMSAAHEMRADIGTTPDDVVAVTEPLTTRVVLTSCLATLLAGACLSVRRHGGANPVRVAEQLDCDEASILLCSNDRLTALRSAGVRAHGSLRVLELAQERFGADRQDGCDPDGGERRYGTPLLSESAVPVRYSRDPGPWLCSR
ncbi:AMP-binding protein [Nocardia altamirensis]|uniref:AMP-binding protein n=1 Tax=Nocardia altamirensis TaxID=472158 RepID=UPI00084006F6|nr:AMP-binding protein [Nocardia altamirensis]